MCDEVVELLDAFQNDENLAVFGDLFGDELVSSEDVEGEESLDKNNDFSSDEDSIMNSAFVLIISLVNIIFVLINCIFLSYFCQKINSFDYCFVRRIRI